MSGHYLHSFLAGCGIFGAAYLAKGSLAHLGMQTQGAILDGALLGIFAGLGLFYFLRHLDASRELRRRREHELAIARLNHHIRNALQLIVNRVEMEMHSHSELHDIRVAVDRIDWALREILPHVNVNPNLEFGHDPAAGPQGQGPGMGTLIPFRTGAERAAAKAAGTEAPPPQRGRPPGVKISVKE
jgi:hypothetical protein